MSEHQISEWSKYLAFDHSDDATLKTAVVESGRWIGRVKRNDACGRWISLLGPTGTGKTHLAKQLWRFCMGQPDFNPLTVSHYPTWLYWPTFVDQLRSGDAWKLFDDIQKWPYLAIDDFGAEKDTTGFAADKFNTLLGRRIGKWTIITSNLNHGEIANLDARIADRFIRDGNVVVKMNCASYALRKRGGK